MEIETKVFTILKSKLRKKFLTEYPNIYITSSDKTMSSPSFPTVYIHMMSGSEKGMDMEGYEINSIECTFQIEVTTNTSQEDANKITREILNIMKSMMFNVVASPEFNNNSVYRQVVRLRRTISSDDVI